jgi:hypothetical protein
MWYYYGRMKTFPQIMTHVSDMKPDISPILWLGFPEYPIPWFYIFFHLF